MSIAFVDKMDVDDIVLRAQVAVSQQDDSAWNAAIADRLEIQQRVSHTSKFHHWRVYPLCLGIWLLTVAWGVALTVGETGGAEGELFFVIGALEMVFLSFLCRSFAAVADADHQLLKVAQTLHQRFEVDYMLRHFPVTYSGDQPSPLCLPCLPLVYSHRVYVYN